MNSVFQATGTHPEGPFPDPAALAALLGGDLRQRAPFPPIRGVATDSRRVQPGDLFFEIGRAHV